MKTHYSFNHLVCFPRVSPKNASNCHSMAFFDGWSDHHFPSFSPLNGNSMGIPIFRQSHMISCHHFDRKASAESLNVIMPLVERGCASSMDSGIKISDINTKHSPFWPTIGGINGMNGRFGTDPFFLWFQNVFLIFWRILTQIWKLQTKFNIQPSISINGLV